MYDFNIVTLHKAYNYGAALQAFALKTHLCELGYKAGIYDAEQIHYENKSIRNLAIKSVNNICKLPFKRQFEQKKFKFQKFATDNFDLNTSVESKAFLSGSDQVWNPIVINPKYYLDFIPENSVRASYAASIGVSKLPDHTKEIYESYLSKFDYISVREQSAKNELSGFLPGRDIRVDLDPTFLLDKDSWVKTSLKGENNLKEEYILLYILHIPENINDICKWLRKELNAKIVLIDTNGYMGLRIMHDKIVRNVGPNDFLALVRDAKAVITTSFHGTAFSILFEKEFYSIINPSFPSRVQNILDYLEISPISNAQKEFSRLKVDYDLVHQKLNESRSNSDLYFKTILDCFEGKK